MNQTTQAAIILDKELRRDIDGIIQRLKIGATQHGTGLIPTDELRQTQPPIPPRPSRERSTAITKLQEAVMWLGMDLKVINEENPGEVPNPYPHSKDPSTTKIDPTADNLKL